MTQDEQQQVFRLTDMKVEEVSLVDRAANKRKFLVVKGEVMEHGAEVKPDGKGGHTAKDAPVVVPMKLTASIKAEAVSRVAAVAAGCAELAKILETAEVIDSGSVPEELSKKLGDLAAILVGPGGDVGKAMEPVEKGLKQISRAREAKLRDALKLLGDIVKDIDANASDSTATEKTAESDPTATKKNVDEIRADVSALADSVTKSVEKIVDSLRKQAARIETVEKSSRGVSNAAPAETAQVVAKGSGDEPWPLDMNRPTIGGTKS